MFFDFNIIALIASFGAFVSSYQYPEIVRDTSNHVNPFYLIAKFGPTYIDGKNIQLRPNGGDLLAVVDAESPVLRAQLDQGVLQSMHINKYNQQVFTGYTAELRKVSLVDNSKLRLFDVVFTNSSTAKAWSEEFPRIDGIYSLSHRFKVPSQGGITTGFIICEVDSGAYYQLKFTETTASHTKKPPGCHYIGVEVSNCACCWLSFPLKPPKS